MATEQCTVSPQYVGTEHGGDVHQYRSTAQGHWAPETRNTWWICDAHAEGAPARGINWLVLVDNAPAT